MAEGRDEKQAASPTMQASTQLHKLGCAVPLPRTGPAALALAGRQSRARLRCCIGTSREPAVAVIAAAAGAAYGSQQHQVPMQLHKQRDPDRTARGCQGVTEGEVQVSQLQPRKASLGRGPDLERGDSNVEQGGWAGRCQRVPSLGQQWCNPPPAAVQG